MGRVYAVVSAKGGVGKTTTAANLAAALAAAGSRVVVVDGDLGMPNLAGALGVDVGEVTLHDLLTDDAVDLDAAAAIHEGPHGLAVVPGSPTIDAFSRADPERLDDVLSALAEEYDDVILDTGAGLSNDTVAPLTFVDEILLVSTPTRDALGDTDRTREVAERLGVTVAGAALLRADSSAAESDVVVENLDVGVLGTVPDADVIRQAAETGEPVSAFAPDSPAAAAFASLATGLTGEHVGVSGASAAATSDSEAVTPENGTHRAASDDTGGSSDATPPSADTVSIGDEPGSTNEPGAEADGTESPRDVADPDPAASDDGRDAAGATPVDETGGSEPDGSGAQSADAEEGSDSTDSGSEPGSAVDVSTAESADAEAESPVEPVHPDVLTSDGDDARGRSTPLEEVPIEEAEPAGPSTGSGGDDPEGSGRSDTQDAADGSDARDDTESGEDAEAEADANADPGSDDGNGFFSRFFA